MSNHRYAHNLTAGDVYIHGRTALTVADVPTYVPGFRQQMVQIPNEDGTVTRVVMGSLVEVLV